MVDKSKKGKKASISEEGVSDLLDRYSATTVLNLLHEVAQVAEGRIDWHEIVKNTATGISSAREYQLLWRHLAYGETLPDQFDDGSNPVDDDSDLEYELEAFPAVSREASIEAAACVKVLIASGCPNGSHQPNNTTVEAPMTINIPSSRAVAASSDGSNLTSSTKGTNISIPVFVPKPVASGVTGEKRPNPGPVVSDMAPKRKRRAWSNDEDAKLANAVQKHGERNWASIARGEFKNDRKASELSQRWANLRKKQGNANAGSSAENCETQLAAAHRAMSFALNMPMGDSLKTASQLNSDNHLGRAGLPKPQMSAIRPAMNPISTPDSLVKAAAVAAGARIATSADASSLLEAARSQNVVHITTGGSAATKPSPSGIASQLPSNVHFIRNGLARAPISTYAATKPNVLRPSESQQTQARAVKPGTAPPPQPNPPVPPTSPLLNAKPGVENAVASIPSTSALPKTKEDASASTPSNEPKEIVLVDQATDRADISSCTPMEQKDHQPSTSVNPQKENTQDHQPSLPISGQTGKTHVDLATPSSQVEGTDEKIPDSQSASKEVREDSSSGGGHEDVVNDIVGGEGKQQ